MSGPTHQKQNNDPLPSELHVVTEDGEQCFMWRSNQLTYIAPNRSELPLVLATKFGHLATKLDLSYNNLTSFRNINLFTNLSELILDNNCLEDDQLDFRQNLRLKTLSLNKNKLCDLFKLIISIKVCFPNLEFLSLIGNQFYPIKISLRASSSGPITTTASRSPHSIGAVSGGASGGSSANVKATTSAPIDLRDSSRYDVDKQTDFANQKYRYFIVNHLPNLHFLDSKPIGSQERDEALNSCFWVEATNSSDRYQWAAEPTIIWGQLSMQNDGHYVNIDNNGSLNGLIRESDHVGSTYHREAATIEQQQQVQLQIITANGENNHQLRKPKGQFSRQVKCQMVGGFKFARALLWTLISLTSTNLVHCSGALLALSLKGLTGNNKSRQILDGGNIKKR